MEVENIYYYQEIYNKIKSYVVGNQIQISGCLIIKIITLISIYRKFYIFVDKEQIEIDKEYNIAQFIKPMNSEIKNKRILNIIFYENIYDEIIKLYYIISYRITRDRSNYKVLNLTDTEKRYECFNYPNLIFNFYSIIWQLLFLILIHLHIHFIIIFVNYLEMMKLQNMKENFMSIVISI